MKKILKNAAAITFSEFFLVGVAILRNKYLALSIGPNGFGLYSLLNSFFSMFSVFAGTWIGAGTTKYIAEYNNENDREKMNQIYTFSIFSIIIIGSVFTIIFILFRKYFITHFLSLEVLEFYFLLFAAGFIGMNLGQLFISILQGVTKIKMVIQSRLINSVMDVLFVVGFIWIFQVQGFFISIFISSIFSSLIFYFYIKKSGFKICRFSFKQSIIKKLISFGGISLYTGLINLGSVYLQRILIVQKLGINSLGLFQAAFSIMTYAGLIIRGANFQLLPAMSKRLENSNYISLLNNYLSFILLITIPISVFAIVFGQMIITLLYSENFLQMISFLYWFIIAQFLTNIMTCLQTTIVGMAKLKIHAIAVTGIHLLWVICPAFLLGKMGIASVGIGFILGSMIGGIVYFIYLRNRIGYFFTKRVQHLFIYGVIVILISIGIRDTHALIHILFVLIVLYITFMFLNDGERRQMKNMIFKRLNSLARK
jgi:O-antigen/teichoic acid export membrane protein